MQTINKHVALEPITLESVPTEIRSGFAYNSNRLNLIKAKVVFSYKEGQIDLRPGDLVFLRGDVSVHPWTRVIWELDGQKFVLCPVDQIIGIEKFDNISKSQGIPPCL